MNEQKKIYILLGIAVAVVALILGVNFSTELKSKKVLENLDEVVAKDSKQIIVIGKDNCPYCQMFVPLLDYMKEQYSFDYTYINTNKITSKTLTKILEKLNINAEEFGTPHLTLTENGNIVDEIAGYVDEKELLAFLQKYGFASEDAKLSLNYIGMDEYRTLINSQTPEVIVVGQTSCSHCMMAKPALLNIATKYGVKINYLNMTEIKDEENGTELINEFNSSLTYLQNEEWGTPLMMIVKDKEVVATSNGYLSENNYVKFLKDQGIIGE